MMAKNHFAPFKDLPSPSGSLAARIMLHIEAEERRRLMVKAVTFGGMLVASVAVLAYGSMAAAAQASHTGFWTFFSLLFTDFSATVATFSDYIFSIAEAFPVFPAALFFAGTFFAVWSAMKFINEIVLIRGNGFRRTAS